MLVCHCRRVSDRQIRAAVHGGACTPDQVGEFCGAGAECGGCHPLIEEIIERERPLPALSLLAERGAQASP